MHPVEKYEVFLRIADEDEECLYLVEHWFPDRPEIETISSLFDEAKRAFVVLFPQVEPEDFCVEVRRLRPADDHRPYAQQPTE